MQSFEISMETNFSQEGFLIIELNSKFDIQTSKESENEHSL